MIKFNAPCSVLTLLGVLIALLAYGQGDRLEGLVADEKGAPLPWAHVVIVKKARLVLVMRKVFSRYPAR
jgi:hypothetical protein